ncbi:JAB N-terminal domain-containing protein [Frankia sp. Cas4]|uniref:JAB N-terminal domain-containing protein n=1 Tax=Frankia sp. Cas4 TaxID=3073927 RepID=UPI002AD4D096|nr:JAB N-terminal domain-containing protein [Frankia sp. Cas4]
MSAEVELYRTDDYVRVGRVPLVPLLQAMFERVLGEALVGSRFELSFLPVADRSELAGNPSVVNLRSSHGYVQVRIVRDGRLLYQHPHAVREIIARPLQRLLAEQIPAETHWGFGIRGPGFDRVALVRPAPEVEGRVEVTVGSGRPRLFHLEEIHEPDPPTATLAELGADMAAIPGAEAAEAAEAAPAASPGVAVVVDRDVADALKHRMTFSTEVEEGGFLAGHVYRDADRPGSHLVKITAAIPGERTGASLLHFTFTGESFLRINEQLARSGRDERLVGWYHTHLFPATSEIGLSSIDVELHTTTFRRPWQVAGLVNIDRHDRDDRVLRFYHAQATAAGAGAPDATATEDMVLASYWVATG